MFTKIWSFLVQLKEDEIKFSAIGTGNTGDATAQQIFLRNHNFPFWNNARSM